MIKNFKTFEKLLKESKFLNESVSGQLKALNSMMKTKYIDSSFGKFTIPDFECWDAAAIVFFYCQNLSKKFTSPQIWTCKNVYHAFVVAKFGNEQIVIDPVALNQTHLGIPMKPLKDIYNNPEYGKEFEKYNSLESYMLKNAGSISIEIKEIEFAAEEELKFLG